MDSFIVYVIEEGSTRFFQVYTNTLGVGKLIGSGFRVYRSNQQAILGKGGYSADSEVMWVDVESRTVDFLVRGE